MELKEKDRLEWEDGFRKLGLMSEDDVIEERTLGDYWSFMVQSRGRYFFTREKVIFMHGLGLEYFAIKYSDIREIRKCLICFLVPMGIRVVAVDEKGKNKKYIFSVLKTKYWLELLSRKSGVTC